jgi:mannose/fructose/N-acetylgalactosamine-specific phosphotransferase system component IIC
MAFAVWRLGKNCFTSAHPEQRQLGTIALLVIIPWIGFTLFAGMGPPPTSIPEWVETATEQQIRYALLIAGGMLITVGLALLANKLRQSGEKQYWLLGLLALVIALPLFILNMAYWGSFLVESFTNFSAASVAKRPDWYLSIRALFSWISGVEVALLYLATAAFGLALRSVGWLKSTACRLYVVFSLVGALLSVLPSFSFEPIGIVTYLVSIPAFPFIMPYLMALNLLNLANRNPKTDQ